MRSAVLKNSPAESIVEYQMGFDNQNEGMRFHGAGPRCGRAEEMSLQRCVRTSD